MKKLSFEEVLEGIENPRRERSVQYPLVEVLIYDADRRDMRRDIVCEGGDVR